MNKSGLSAGRQPSKGKALAVLLALFLAVSLVPAMAFAGEQDQQDQQGQQNQQVQQDQLGTQSQLAEQQQKAEQSQKTDDSGIAQDAPTSTSAPDLEQGSEGSLSTFGSDVATAQGQGAVGTLDDSGEDDTVTVTYVYPAKLGEGTGVHEVLDGLVGAAAPLPKGDLDPAHYGRVAFRGWFTVANPDDAASPYDFSALLTTSNQTSGLTLYATFSNTHLITYKDQDGKVIQTDKLEPGVAIYGPTQDTVELIVAPADARLLHWYVEGGDPLVAFNFGSFAAVASDMTFLPYFSGNYVVIFNSGGSYTEPQTVIKGELATTPSAPTRSGYSFVHWYEEGTDSANAFDFNNTAIAKDTTLLAKWSAGTVSYAVDIWMEKPNFSGTPTPGNMTDYNYISSVTLDGTAGEQTTLEITALPASVTSLFTSLDSILRYGTVQSIESKEIQGNGQTVINLYVTRTLYTYEFNMGLVLDRTMTIDGATYFGGEDADRYSIEVKYEMDISGIFPVQGVDFVTFDAGLSASGFSSWVRPGTIIWKDAATVASIRKIVDEGMLSKDGQLRAYTFTSMWHKSNVAHDYRYFVATYPGQDLTGLSTITLGTDQAAVTYVLMREYNQRFFGLLEAKTISGLERISYDHATYYYASDGTYALEADENKELHRCFFYNRIVQPLTFNTMSPIGETVLGTPDNKILGFGEPLVAHTPAAPSVQSGSYFFKGWYRDAGYKEALDFSTLTMPIGGMTAYAKWESADNTVVFLEGRGGASVGQQGVASGGYSLEKTSEYLSLDSSNFASGRGKFLGWYYDIHGIPVKWSFDTQIYSDHTLYAAWATSGFTVQYDAGLGSGVAPTDSSTYNMYMTARVLGGSTLIPPAGQVFYAWKDALSNTTYYSGNYINISTTGDVSLVAQYAPQLAVTIAVANSSKIYGDRDPAFSWASTGNASVNAWLAAHPEYLTRASGESVVSEGYAITATADGLAALSATFPEYSFVVAPGNFAITLRTLTFTAGSTSGPYTGQAYTVDTFELSGLVPDHNIAGVSVNTSATEAGAHVVGFIGSASVMAGNTPVGSNYHIVYVLGAITITGGPAVPPVTPPVVPPVVPPVTPVAPVTPAVVPPVTPDPDPSPAPVAAPVPTPATAVAAPTVAPPATPSANSEVIDAPSTPLATAALHWALINLIIAIVCVLAGVVLLITAFMRNKRRDENTEERTRETEDENTNKAKSGFAWRVVGILAAIAAPILFILTEDMSLPMQLVDYWTIWMVVILVVQIAGILLIKWARRGKEESGEEVYQG